mmetsp:Transcript_12236/g.18765  ORF Transcript_12236/g.18765 Transcript_12236/m.18765 type:complete len:466 (-) Transcript_12236:29-1426(-)
MTQSSGLTRPLIVLLASLVLFVILAIIQGSTTFPALDAIAYDNLPPNPFADFFVEISQLPAETTNRSSTVAEASAPVIGYAVSMTQCDPTKYSYDQAAVLFYSIHRNSIRNPSSGSKYDYKLYAFVHPDASDCAEGLERIGYEVSIRKSPVDKNEIKGNLKEYVDQASCCQEKEFLKLYSYTLVEHDVVVHLDLDCLLFQPLDDLYDSMVTESKARSQLPLQWGNGTKNLPTDIEAFFTRDYNLVDPPRRQPHEIGVQGGFIVVKPNIDIFNQYKEIIIEGHYTVVEGWGGPALKYGGYYGAAQIQGLMSYFFGHIRPGKAVELNRCYYNFMGDAPKSDEGECRTLEKECQDCRKIAFTEIKSIHFTICTKPWWCLASEYHNRQIASALGGKKPFELCLASLSEWFRFRFLLEKAWSQNSPDYKLNERSRLDELNNHTEYPRTFGYCERPFQYRPMTLPKAPIKI